MTKTILILAANPSDTNELDLTSEYKHIKALKQQSRQGDDFVIDYTPAASAEDLQQQLLNLKPYIVHFCGHGETNGLCFQGDDGKTHFIHQDSLSDFFSLFSGRIQCVILNACDSKQQAKAIAQHIDYVIGMNRPIGDDAAIKFAEGFYRALFSGETITAAYQFGCSAIDLANNPEYQTPELFEKSSTTASNHNKLNSIEMESPEGTVPLNSQFYVERPPIEEDCYRTIEKSYALIRIKAPRQMGKSSLLARVLDHAQQQGQRTVWLSFQESENGVFDSLDSLLQWFCASVADELGLPDRLDELWKGVLGASRKTTNYFERYLLQNFASLTLGLDEVDKVFEHEKVASDFLGLLRAWHERSKSGDATWKNFRLIITHSKEVYIPLNINQSPFNVGSSIELPEFTTLQITDLLQRYQVHWSTTELDSFIEMVGGHPFLVRVGLYEIARQRLTLSDFLQIAATEQGLYCDHLRRHLLNLQKSGLTTVAKQVMTATEPVLIDSSDAFKLQSMGLVRRTGNKVQPLCQLYRLYFCERL